MCSTSRKKVALVLSLGAVTLGALACAGESLPPPPRTDGQFATSSGASSVEPSATDMGATDMGESMAPAFGGAVPTDDSATEIPSELDTDVEAADDSAAFQTDDSAADDSAEPTNVNGAGLGQNPPMEPEPVIDVADPVLTDDTSADDSAADDSAADDTSMDSSFGGMPADDSADDSPFGGPATDDSATDDSATDDDTSTDPPFGGMQPAEPEEPEPTEPTPPTNPTPPGGTAETCTNVRPTGTDWDEGTCDGWATETTECDSDWMVDNNYCNESCGRC